MSSASRVPLLVGNKGRKPTRLPIAPKARPTNVERVKRVESAVDTPEVTKETERPSPAPRVEASKSPERAALPAVHTPVARRGSGIAPGQSINVVRPGSAGSANGRSPTRVRPADSTARSPGQTVERLSKITSKTAIPLFRPQEPRTHASPILGPRATPIPAPHNHHGEQPQQEQNPLLKRLSRKLDIKPHQSPRRAALHQHTAVNASPLLLSSAGPVDVPHLPLESTKQTPKKRGTKRRNPDSSQENNLNASNTVKRKPQRDSLRRKVKKENSYKDTGDSAEDAAMDDDEEYDEGDGHDNDDDLDLPERNQPAIYMPARERATLWAKKVLREQEGENDGEVESTAIVKKETRRKRSNSSSSITSSTPSRKSKTEELLKKEPSQMTMGELALSIPKGRRMLRHETEESADHNTGSSGTPSHRVRSLSMSSEGPSFGGSIITPQVEIVDGKMVILESAVKVNDAPESLPDLTDDSVRRPRGTRYLAPNMTPGRRWTKDETKQFYYCLSQVGPNFSMMATLFPNRKRKELKSKFKYEEKHHPELIEIALKASAAPLDSEIVDVIAQVVDNETKKKEAKRRKKSEDLDGSLNSPATVSSSVVPTPPPGATEFTEEHFGDYYRERKDSFDFSS
ncbi:hypothetical protein Poli38472_013613 [Pythium oligandrum]|uniref:Myb-like domain-containing protein n=1 Tax=Pythium oligandrum TaxID=41045 RepID=A0A8K1CDH1_PYTOL|nr:hypothetical protein Poli38472_013613 [Pythium oligandrum]|eukprot:TMW61150.1 hypothetical protein Poli38472_013613 [Pythium oligandrum]